jgi:drug/metabolite transporter (DMT)-like permease
MWGLLAAVGLAIYFMLSSATDAEPLPPIVMVWASMCVGVAVLGTLAAIGVLSMTATASDVNFIGQRVSWIVPVLGLSLLAAVIAYVSGIGAARRLGAKVASFTGLAEVLFAVLFAWLLLNQLPSGLQLLGGAFIITGVALVRVDELRGTIDPTSTPGPAEQPQDTAVPTQTGQGLAAHRPAPASARQPA